MQYPNPGELFDTEIGKCYIYSVSLDSLTVVFEDETRRDYTKSTFHTTFSNWTKLNPESISQLNGEILYYNIETKEKNPFSLIKKLELKLEALRLEREVIQSKLEQDIRSWRRKEAKEKRRRLVETNNKLRTWEKINLPGPPKIDLIPHSELIRAASILKTAHVVAIIFTVLAILAILCIYRNHILPAIVVIFFLSGLIYLIIYFLLIILPPYSTLRRLERKLNSHKAAISKYTSIYRPQLLASDKDWMSLIHEYESDLKSYLFERRGANRSPELLERGIAPRYRKRYIITHYGDWRDEFSSYPNISDASLLPEGYTLLMSAIFDISWRSYRAW